MVFDTLTTETMCKTLRRFQEIGSRDMSEAILTGNLGTWMLNPAKSDADAAFQHGVNLAIQQYHRLHATPSIRRNYGTR
jgi:hypothetical protein